jgi:hypothetical protein
MADNTNQNINHLGLTPESFDNFKYFVRQRSLNLFPHHIIEDTNKPGIQIYIDNALEEMSSFIDKLCDLPDKESRAKAIHDETYRLAQIYKTQPSSVYCHTTRAYSSFFQACTRFEEYFEDAATCAAIADSKKETEQLKSILEEERIKNTTWAIDNYAYNNMALESWYRKTLKKLKFFHTDKPEDNLVLPENSTPVTDEQWKVATTEQLHKLRSKYGFEKIFIEHDAKWKEVYFWTQNLEKIMSDYCHDFNLHYQSLSLNGNVNLAYDPHYLKDNNATGTVTGGVQPTLSIQYNDIQSMRRTLIHEYTHLLDRKAGMQYLKQKFPDWSDNHIYKKYANQSGVYLSHQLLEEISHNEHNIPLPQLSQSKNSSLSFMRELMTHIMSNQSVEEYYINQQNKIAQIKESMQLSIINELLRKTGYDWPLLDKTIQKAILQISEFQVIVDGTIQSLIEQKASLVNEKTFQNQPMEKGTPWFNTVDKIAEHLQIPQKEKENFYQNLWQKMPSIILNCEAIIQNYGMTMISGLHSEPFTLLAQSKVAKASFDLGNLASLKKRRKYYIKPLEMLARHIESLYEPDSALLEDTLLIKTYPQLELDNQFKLTLKQSLNHLLEIADIKPYEHEHVTQKTSELPPTLSAFAFTKAL